MARNYSNIALDTTLTAGIAAGALSMVVASAAGWPAAPFAAVLDPGSLTIEEVVQVTAKVGTTFTITRGFDGTTAAAHSLGATVRHSAIAGDFTDLQAALLNVAYTNVANTFTLGPNRFNAGADGNVALAARRHSSIATANIFETQDESGAVLVYGTAAGDLVVKGGKVAISDAPTFSPTFLNNPALVANPTLAINTATPITALPNATDIFAALFVDIGFNNAVPIANSLIASYANLQLGGTSNYGFASGLQGVVQKSTTGTVTDMSGLSFGVNNYNTGTVTSAFPITVQYSGGDGVITGTVATNVTLVKADMIVSAGNSVVTAYGASVRPILASGSTVTTFAAFRGRMTNVNAGAAITSMYGLWIDKMVGGSTIQRAILTDGGTVHFKTGTATVVGAMIQAFAAQSADLLQLLASDGTTKLAYFDSAGELFLPTKTANTVYAGPTSGGAARPAFRALVAADIPILSSIYQPIDSDLTALAALTTTAYGRSLLEAATAAALRTLAGLVIGTDVQAPATTLAGYGITDAASDSELTAHEADTTSVHGIADTSTLYRAGGTDVALADGGTGASLADPNADRILFWDDSAGALTWLTPGTNLTITDTTIDAAGGGGVSDGDKGDITVSGSGATWTVDNDAISYAKMQDVSATDKVLGRSTAGAGNVEEIAFTAAARALSDDASAAAMRETLGLEPRDLTTYYDYDDFTSGTATSGGIGKLGWTAGSGTTTTLSSTAGRPGIINRSTSTTINTIATLLFRTTVGAGPIWSGDTFDCRTIFRLNTNDSDTTLRVGLANSPSGNPPVDGIFLEKLAADTNWFFVCRAANTQTRTDSAVACSTNWIKLRIRRSGANILFSLNGGSETTISTNVPSLDLQPSQMITNATATAKTYDIDFFDILITGMAAR